MMLTQVSDDGGSMMLTQVSDNGSLFDCYFKSGVRFNGTTAWRIAKECATELKVPPPPPLPPIHDLASCTATSPPPVLALSRRLPERYQSMVTRSPGLKGGMPLYGHPEHLNASPR